MLGVRHVACRAAEKGTSAMECQDANALVLPLRGVFMEHFSRDSRVLAEPNVALIFPKGRSYRVSHPVSADDDCLAIDFCDSCFQEAVEGTAPSTATAAPGTHGLLAPSAMAARNLIWRRLARQFADPLEIEETGVALLSYALRRSRDTGAPPRRSSRVPGQIEAAKVVLLTHPQRKWSLRTLARAVGCSPFHLTRMFRQNVGVPLHRYQLQTRLAISLDLLLDTDRDLTTIALDLGFSSHSHFTASFRQAVGMSPSRLRDAASSRVAAQVRKILIAPLS